MAIRFTSFEAYKQLLSDKQTGIVSGKATFLAGLAAGVTEAVAVVTPMEVIKIRLQAQHHSMADPLDVPKYRNAAHALYTVVREEGIGALYRGVSLTALRQGSNQAVNFTAYTYFKEWLKQWQPQYEGTNLPGYQTTIIGLVSGAMGPLSNAPIDTIKTRLQKTPAEVGTSAWSRITKIAAEMFKYVSFPRNGQTFSLDPNANNPPGKRVSTPSTRASPPESCESPPARRSPSPSTSI
jgi:solute carrier family 25 citrate transporter 1